MRQPCSKVGMDHILSHKHAKENVLNSDKVFAVESAGFSKMKGYENWLEKSGDLRNRDPLYIKNSLKDFKNYIYLVC